MNRQTIAGCRLPSSDWRYCGLRIADCGFLETWNSNLKIRLKTDRHGASKVWTPRQRLLPLLLAAALAAGCGDRGSKTDGAGTIECTEVRVAPLVGGRIAEMPAHEGMPLKKGDLVARLDTADRELRLREAQALQAQAQAQLDLLRAGSREEDIARAREQMREAKAAAGAAEADRRRIEDVFEKGSATQKQLDDARAQSDRAAATLAAAEQALKRFEKGNRVEDIRVAETAVELAAVRVAQARKAVDDATVTAPMNGLVTARLREEGDVVSGGSPLILLSRLDEVWLTIYVPETRLAGVRIGQTAAVRPDGRNDWRNGTVTYVSPEAEFTPRNTQTAEERAKLVYRVKITLPNPDGIFKPGQPAEAILAPADAATPPSDGTKK